MKKSLIMILLLVAGVTSACSRPAVPAKIDSASPAATSTGLANPASVYCLKQGGKSVIITSPDGSQYGNCLLPNGHTCEEWAYYRGTCK